MNYNKIQPTKNNGFGIEQHESSVRQNEKSLYPFYRQLHELVISEDYLTDKSGVKIAEIIAPRIVLDPRQRLINFKGRKSPKKYIAKESDWYLSCNLSIEKVQDVKIWRDIADTNGEVNSNYGSLVFSRANFSQFENVVKTLSAHKESRQGIIIYNRPSIHYEWNSHGCSDFICTLNQQFFIRENKLVSITSMRSADCILGTFNDLPFFHFVIEEMHKALLPVYQELEIGDHIFIPNSFHVYEQHFELLKEIVEQNKDLEG